MTVGKHIAIIRGLINQYSDDSHYENEYLYALLNTANAMWLKRKSQNFEKINDWNWQSFCVGLEVTKAHDCSCVAVGCSILRTRTKIPKPILAKNRTLNKVLTLDGVEIPLTTEEELRAWKHDEVKKGKLGYSVHNDKIIIWNGNTNSTIPRAIIIKQLPFDVTEWSGIKMCDPDGSVTNRPCFDLATSSYPMDEEYADLVYNTVLEKLGFSLKIPQDRTNNANPQI